MLHLVIYQENECRCKAGLCVLDQMADGAAWPQLVAGASLQIIVVEVELQIPRSAVCRVALSNSAILQPMADDAVKPASTVLFNAY